MIKTYPLPFEDSDVLMSSLLHIASGFDTYCLLNANHYTFDKYGKYDLLLAMGVKDEYVLEKNTRNGLSGLDRFLKKHAGWTFGALSYNLKNHIEDLSSANFDGIHFPDLHFFVPAYVLSVKGDQLSIYADKEEDALSIYREIAGDTGASSPVERVSGHIQNRIEKSEYIETVKNIQADIRYGNIYEMNYCQEFYMQDVSISPGQQYLLLNKVSPAPFSALYKFRDVCLLSSSPERFLRKQGKIVLSQPIKGTIRRGAGPQEDERLKRQLQNDPKERAENIMIVDLVRNDLSKHALPGRVRVEELCGIYAFPQVFQMISTVSAAIKDGTSFSTLIKDTFPMGSMTGAPKIKAMELIEQYEATDRGLYSGSVGYIDPDGDFDFNVIIRSILYNAENKYLSYMAGGAITAKSDHEKEYEETLVKSAILKDIFSG